MEIKDVTKALVIYHANCVDGFASAWAFHVLKEKEYEGGVKYVPCSYTDMVQEDLFDLEQDVYILDFSFKRGILTYIAKCSNKVLVLDHHKTAREELENWTDHPDNLSWIFDMERSGAGITWDFFAEGSETRPEFINYIEDRDLWKFNLYKSKEVNAFISFQDKTFIEYSVLDELAANDMANIGNVLLHQHQRICEQIVEDARETTIHTGSSKSYNGLACNCTPQFSSEVGNLLAIKSGTFGATYHSQKDGTVKWSIRSTGDYDVSEIAKRFGGGGHKNAAGFVVMLNPKEEVDPAKITLSEVP